VNGDQGGGSLTSDGRSSCWARFRSNGAVGTPRIYKGITVTETGSSMSISGRIHFSDGVKYPMTFSVIGPGAAVPAVLNFTPTANATNFTTVPWGPYTTQVDEWRIDNTTSGFTVTMNGVASGQYLFSGQLNLASPALPAGVTYAISTHARAPSYDVDLAVLSDTERLELLKDSNIDELMRKYFVYRAELGFNGVGEEWWLQALHSYIIGADRNFTNFQPLTALQQARIKSRMLAVDTWEQFADLTGFLNKLFDDLGSLVALAQSTDFE